jgi:hypothetical protein
MLVRKPWAFFPHVLAVMFLISQNSLVRSFENLISEKQAKMNISGNYMALLGEEGRRVEDKPKEVIIRVPNMSIYVKLSTPRPVNLKYF